LTDGVCVTIIIPAKSGEAYLSFRPEGEILLGSCYKFKISRFARNDKNRGPFARPPALTLSMGSGRELGSFRFICPGTRFQIEPSPGYRAKIKPMRNEHRDINIKAPLTEMIPRSQLREPPKQ